VRDRPELLRIIREAAAHLRAWRKIGLSTESGAFEDWEADMREALHGLLGESNSVSIQIFSLIEGVKRRIKLGMGNDVAFDSLAPEIEELTSSALKIAEENPPHVRTLGDIGTIVEARRLYDPSLGRVLNSIQPGAEGKATPDRTKVFVVHGRNTKLSMDFFSFLRALGLHPMEWEEAIAGTGKASPYVGEVLDYAFSAAAAIVVLLSPDDEVRLSPSLRSDGDGPDEQEIRLQARPNVLFEAGMAMGRDPDRTLLIEVGQTKRFSDVGGRHTIRLANDPKKRNAVASRLKTAGCAVQMVGDHWMVIGDFDLPRQDSFPIWSEASQAEISIDDALSSLSDFAKELLKKAAQDNRGTIMTVHMLEGLHVQTADSAWEPANPRDEAEMENDLGTLEAIGLIEGVGENSYRLTTEGFKAAEQLTGKKK
jgi:predicted nucleotide-binding protein